MPYQDTIIAKSGRDLRLVGREDASQPKEERQIDARFPARDAVIIKKVWGHRTEGHPLKIFPRQSSGKVR